MTKDKEQRQELNKIALGAMRAKTQLSAAVEAQIEAFRAWEKACRTEAERK